MRVWRAANIREIMAKRGMTPSDFTRKMERVADDYGPEGLKPSNQHTRSIINGTRVPSPYYVALMADVLGCKTDDFFEHRPRRSK